jgi:hypothetical protein
MFTMCATAEDAILDLITCPRDHVPSCDLIGLDGATSLLTPFGHDGNYWK